ncbi:tail fiber domain-containing protein [uncultured Chryseobacterium sp.]|uniref:tail fiber domain-containing protein n=1 Tax=uncultured Chryseobacterium sp. TaxID=259322 RepID=UPI0025E9CA30|nr:tail fiber domain-containing protein [uncultured Chryseobacterium sp.]
MKKNILTVAALVVFAGMQAQIQTNNGVTNGITNSNVLLDGSSGFSTEAGAGPYVGKGVVIPSVDLVNFQFDLSQADGFTFPTYFDGMIVYNNATGNTLTTGNRPSTSLAVTPGFYYFYNPNGASNGNITGGQWKALGGTATGDNLGNHSATQTLALNGFDLRLKGAADGNQALAYNAAIDGPRLWGNAGGALGTINGTNALTWDNSGNVTSPGAIISGTKGNARLVPGDATNAGYLSIHKGDGSQVGYIGFDPNNMRYSTNGVHNFLQSVVGESDIYAGTNKSFHLRGTSSSIAWDNYGGAVYMDDANNVKIGGNKALMNPTAAIISGAQGNARLVPGDATNAGYLSIHKGDGSQVGYIGYNTTNMFYAASGIHVFNTTIQTPRVQGPSDRRFKKDITPIYNATEKLNQLNGYTYTWKDKKEFPGQTLGTGKDMGVIAQEVEKVFQDAVMTNKEGYKSVNYNALIPVLIESLKEAHREIKELKEELKKK